MAHESADPSAIRLSLSLSLLILAASIPCGVAFARRPDVCQHVGAVPEWWQGGEGCLDDWIRFNQAIWNDLFIERRLFDPAFPCFAVQEHWGQWLNPSQTTGVNQFGDVFDVYLHFSEPIDWTLVDTSGLPPGTLDLFVASGGVALRVGGVLWESWFPVLFRGCLVSYISAGGQPIDLLFVTENLSRIVVGGDAPAGHDARGGGTPPACVCPGCGCDQFDLGPLSHEQEQSYCVVYCQLVDRAVQRRDDAAWDHFKCVVKSHGLGTLGLFSTCVVGLCTAPAGAAPAIAGGAVVMATTVSAVVDCKKTYDRALEQIDADLERDARDECFRRCVAANMH